MDNVLELSNITKYYRNKIILNSISMTIKRGDVCAIIGENGAGKSTLISCIVGLTQPTSGSIQLFGNKDHFGLNAMRRRVGFVPDTSACYPDLDARKNLEIRCAEWGFEKSIEVDRVLRLVDFSDAPYIPVRDYSLGMRRRLDIAIALLGSPDFLVFDEPANGLDPEGIASIWRLIRMMNHEFGKTVLVSSHDLDELSGVASVYAFIHMGKLLACVPAGDVAKQEISYDDRRAFEKACALRAYYRRLYMQREDI